MITSGEHTGMPQTIVAVISASAPGEFLIIIYSLMIVTALEYGGSIIVVTARYLTNKWVKPLQDKFREEGRQEGRLEGRQEGVAEGRVRERQAWVDRERRRLEAEAQGILFDEPFPGTEDESPSSNGATKRE